MLLEKMVHHYLAATMRMLFIFYQDPNEEGFDLVCCPPLCAADE
jgi:hypothetical protein